jgi:hypothetical protein
MLSNIAHLIFRLRYGLAVLTAFTAISAPVTALAVTPISASSPQSATYTNLAQALAQNDRQLAWNLQFQVRQSYAATLTAKNEADATTSGCGACTADAIAFQVIYTPEQDLGTLNAANVANALTGSARSAAFAGAVQIIYAGAAPQLSFPQIQGLERVHSELMSLEFIGATPSQMQVYVNWMAQQATQILQQGPRLVPVFTPALNNSDRPTRLTRLNSSPFIDLFVRTQNP